MLGYGIVKKPFVLQGPHNDGDMSQHDQLSSKTVVPSKEKSKTIVKNGSRGKKDGGISLKSNPALNPSHYLPNASGCAADNGPNIALMYYSTIDGACLKNSIPTLLSVLTMSCCHIAYNRCYGQLRSWIWSLNDEKKWLTQTCIDSAQQWDRFSFIYVQGGAEPSGL